MILFLELSEVLEFHNEQIHLFGGSFGVRDQGLLESALEMPRQGFGDEFFHEFPFGMASAYLFHLAKNHPFIDGNKRTALYCMEIFLDINGYEVCAGDQELEDLVLDVATGKMGKEGIGQFLKKWSREK